MNKFRITTDYIENTGSIKNITICHISDIHMSKNIKYHYLERLITSIKQLKPDYIMITGDTIDNPCTITNDKIAELITFITKLGTICKVFISIGNHDIISNDDFQVFKDLNKIDNIYVLDNKSYHDEYIYVAGLDLPINYYYNVARDESIDVLKSFLDNQNELINHKYTNIPSVLLVHSPIKLTDNSVINKLANYDLILCGHTHNGMVPPWLNFLFKSNMGLIAPNKELFPKIAKGKIEKEINGKKITIIINGAITKLSRQAGLIFRNLNFLWNGDINKIIIKKEGK